MARTDPNAAAAKWQSRLSAATNDIKSGVEGVTVSPGVAAARQADVWIARVTASKEKWRRNVGAVSLADWQSKMINVGIPRISQGASANQPKMANFLAAFLPHVAQGVAAVRQMPNATLEDRINRATAMIRHNAKFTKPTTPSTGA